MKFVPVLFAATFLLSIPMLNGVAQALAMTILLVVFVISFNRTRLNEQVIEIEKSRIESELRNRTELSLSHWGASDIGLLLFIAAMVSLSFWVSFAVGGDLTNGMPVNLPNIFTSAMSVLIPSIEIGADHLAEFRGHNEVVPIWLNVMSISWSFAIVYLALVAVSWRRVPCAKIYQLLRQPRKTEVAGRDKQVLRLVPVFYYAAPFLMFLLLSFPGTDAFFAMQRDGVIWRNGFRLALTSGVPLLFSMFVLIFYYYDKYRIICR